MNINIWTPDLELVKVLRAFRVVYTLRLPTSEDLRGKLCDEAWTEPGESGEHHWFVLSKYGDSPGPIREAMTFKEYLLTHIRECKPMNDSWRRGREDFIREWSRHHGVNIAGYL